jgi:hypothetical protein
MAEEASAKLIYNLFILLIFIYHLFIAPHSAPHL